MLRCVELRFIYDLLSSFGVALCRVVCVCVCVVLCFVVFSFADSMCVLLCCVA